MMRSVFLARFRFFVEALLPFRKGAWPSKATPLSVCRRSNCFFVSFCRCCCFFRHFIFFGSFLFVFFSFPARANRKPRIAFGAGFSRAITVFSLSRGCWQAIMAAIQNGGHENGVAPQSVEKEPATATTKISTLALVANGDAAPPQKAAKAVPAREVWKTIANRVRKLCTTLLSLGETRFGSLSYPSTSQHSHWLETTS